MALAEDFDRKFYLGLPPYGSIVARAILFHSLAFNEQAKGVNEKGLLYSVLAGVLREALTRLREQARGKRIDALALVSLRLFDPNDGFRLMGAVNAVNGATKIVRLHGGYETNERGTLHVEFEGPIGDALPIKDFLDPQFRPAKDRDFDLAFDLDFADGLPLGGDAPEKLTERLARYSSGRRTRSSMSGRCRRRRRRR